jgi:hypothetical protein
MGRRHRHLNPVHAGASAAFDTRFISGSDGVAQQDWEGRAGSGRTLTQSNASFRPIYRRNVSAAGNQPGLEFVPGSSHRMSQTSSPMVGPTADNFMIFEFATGGTEFISVCQCGTTLHINCYGAGLFPGWFDFLMLRGYISIVNAGGSATDINQGQYNNDGRVVAGGRSSASTIYLKDGISGSTTTNSSMSGSLRNFDNASTQNYRSGTHHAFCVIPNAYSLSIMNRIAHSYAYSFKSFT